MGTSGFRVAALANLGDLVFRLLAGTGRFEVYGAEKVEAARQRSKGLVFVLWHGRLLLGAAAHRGRRTGILISRHRDGEIVTRIVSRHGYLPVRGSTSKGGGAALREMIELAESGVREFALTPDGPRGPRHHAQPGMIFFASRTGYAIVPSSVSAKPGRFFGSWDRFLLPGPLARLVVVYGDAITVPENPGETEVETLTRHIEEKMIDVEAEADRRAGW